jgi:tetratricopeptide (TPR) repeat protein
MTDSIDDLISKGIELGKNEKYFDALKNFLKVLETDKNNVNAWRGGATSWEYIAKEYRRSSNFEKMKECAEESIRCWDEVIKLDDSIAEAWFGKGSVLWDFMRDAENALECFQNATDLDENHVLAYMNMGILLDNVNQPTDAITCFKLALKLDDTCQPLWYNAGVTLAKQGGYQEALDCFNKSIDLDGTHANSWLSKSKILKILGQINESEICMMKYDELTGNN